MGASHSHNLYISQLTIVSICHVFSHLSCSIVCLKLYSALTQFSPYPPKTFPMPVPCVMHISMYPAASETLFSSYFCSVKSRKLGNKNEPNLVSQLPQYVIMNQEQDSQNQMYPVFSRISAIKNNS